MVSLMILGQWRAFMPLYIEQSGDLERCQRCLTHSQTTLKDSATQLLIKYKSGALVTQYKLGTHTHTLCPKYSRILGRWWTSTTVQALVLMNGDAAFSHSIITLETISFTNWTCWKPLGFGRPSNDETAKMTLTLLTVLPSSEDNLRF